MSGYALAYLIALSLTSAVAAGLGRRARLLGVGLLWTAWIWTIAMQGLAGDTDPVMAFAVMGLLVAAGFVAIGALFNRIWAWLAAGFHVAMLLTHVAHVWTGYSNPFVYLSVLTGLGYASMAVIALPPVWQRVRGQNVDAPCLDRFLRGGSLDSSSFPTRKAQKGGKP